MPGLLFGIVCSRISATPAPGVRSEDFSAQIDWGDGKTSLGTVVAAGQGQFAVLGRHVYRDEEPSQFMCISRARRQTPLRPSPGVA
jgi:hypothetical protein